MYKLFIVGLLLAGCGADFESSTSTQSDALKSGCPADKVLLCHQGDTELFEVCVAPGAVQSHVEQGDLVGPCATVGLPPNIPVPEWMPVVPTQPQQIAEETELTALHPRSATVVSPSWTPTVPTPPAQVCVGLRGVCGPGYGECCSGSCHAGMCIPD